MGLTKKDIVFPEVPHDGVLGGKMYDMRGNRIFTDIGRTSWALLWEMTCNEWRRTVEEYEENPGDFHAAWHYLNCHPAFWVFRHGPSDPKPYRLRRRLHARNLLNEDGIRRCVTILVTKVNAETRSTEDGPPLETEIWIELGQQSWPKEVDPKDPETFDAVHHDYLLDCGGPTMETAILRAAHNVWEVYGNDRRVCDAPYDGMAYITVVGNERFEELMRERGDNGEVNERVRRATERLAEILREVSGSSDPRRKKA